MKQYPSIPRDVRYGGPYIVFDKLDGSNIRAEWSKKKGFYKFGSRKVLLGPKGESDQQTLLGRSIELIKELEDPIGAVFHDERHQQAVCFFEFYGQNSFAGVHDPSDHHKVVLFDVHIHKHGILGPSDFLKKFAHNTRIDVPSVLLKGNVNKEVEDRVRSGTFEGMTFEGVVVKSNPTRKWEQPYMFKIKNQAWVDKVRSLYGEKAETYL